MPDLVRGAEPQIAGWNPLTVHAGRCPQKFDNTGHRVRRGIFSVHLPVLYDQGLSDRTILAVLCFRANERGAFL
jgi:hypothetical protein